MSDCKIRYRKIRETLDEYYPTKPKGNFARNLNTLAAMINGIVGSKSTQLPKIAEHTHDEIKLTSVEKRIKRWIINDKIDLDVYFMPFAEALLFCLGLQEIILAMDGSTVGQGCITLMVNVIYKKRALPLAYIVIEGKKGHFPEESHIALLKEIHSIIPEFAQRVIFLGDGEFDGVALQQTLKDWNWLYVCRTGINVKIYIHDEPCDIEDTIGCFLTPGYYYDVKNVLFTHKKYGPVMVVGWWAEGNEEPIYLVTNMKSPKAAFKYYSKRFRIETFFSDQKSRGFNLHKSHLSDPERLSRIMIATCLAYIWIIFFGDIGNETRVEQNHSSHGSVRLKPVPVGLKTPRIFFKSRYSNTCII
jgi:hypothetical protein